MYVYIMCYSYTLKIGSHRPPQRSFTPNLDDHHHPETLSGRIIENICWNDQPENGWKLAGHWCLCLNHLLLRLRQKKHLHSFSNNHGSGGKLLNWKLTTYWKDPLYTEPWVWQFSGILVPTTYFGFQVTSPVEGTPIPLHVWLLIGIEVLGRLTNQNPSVSPEPRKKKNGVPYFSIEILVVQ